MCVGYIALTRKQLRPDRMDNTLWLVVDQRWSRRTCRLPHWHLLNCMGCSVNKEILFKITNQQKKPFNKYKAPQGTHTFETKKAEEVTRSKTRFLNSRPWYVPDDITSIVFGFLRVRGRKNN